MEKEENKNTNDGFNAENLRGGGHLSDEEIIAYQYGKMPSPEIERGAQNHLIECRRCTNLLLELSDFAESTAEIRALNKENTENTDVQWAQFETKRLAESKKANQTAARQPKTAAPPRNKFFVFPSFNFAAAAAAFGILAILAFAAIFLTMRNAESGNSSIALETPPTAQTESAAPQKTEDETAKLKNTSENTISVENSSRKTLNGGNRNSSPPTQEKNKPRNETVNQSPSVQRTNKTSAPQDELALNTTDIELYPNEVLRGGAADVRKIRLKQNTAGQIRLKLKSPASKKPSAFSLEIVDSQNKTVLTLPVLPDKRGDFNLIIPAKNLPADVYSLKIYADQNGARKPFTQYDFELEYK